MQLSSTLRVYSHPMSRNPGERARLKALVAGERTLAAPEVTTSRLDGVTLEAAIRRYLRRRGGRAVRGEVLAALGEELRDRLGPVDLENLPSGMTRWEANTGKARQRLVRRGVLRDDSVRGVWELSEAGGGKTGSGRAMAAPSKKPLAA